ncbi:MAG TPA: hypothetical protein VGP15_19230 [Burkholderiales bacterium]|nr:hypothetical protein [Burkholderiales bacterium]
MACKRAGAQHLCKRHVERAKPRHLARDRSVAAPLVGALLLRRQLLSRMPDRMRKTHVLGEQQKRASELQQRSLETVGRS